MRLSMLLLHENYAKRPDETPYEKSKLDFRKAEVRKLIHQAGGSLSEAPVIKVCLTILRGIIPLKIFHIRIS